MKSLFKKKVLVTGAGTGLGREIALEFSRLGADVVLHYAHSEDGAKSAVESIVKDGGRAVAIAADLRETSESIRLAKEAIDYLGGIDVLVNNAGITMTLEFDKVTPEQFDTLFNVNVKSAFFLIQSVVSTMELSGGGAIINMSSIHGIRACAGHSVYSSTKGALIALTKELSIELAPKGIRVNAVAPGAVPVENHHKAAGRNISDELSEKIPCGFYGTPLDIAKTVVFLASNDARYIIGQTLVVDGGTTSWMSFSDGFLNTGIRLGKGYVDGL